MKMKMIHHDRDHLHSVGNNIPTLDLDGAISCSSALARRIYLNRLILWKHEAEHKVLHLLVLKLLKNLSIYCANVLKLCLLFSCGKTSNPQLPRLEAEPEEATYAELESVSPVAAESGHKLA